MKRRLALAAILAAVALGGVGLWASAFFGTQGTSVHNAQTQHQIAPDSVYLSFAGELVGPYVLADAPSHTPTATRTPPPTNTPRPTLTPTASQTPRPTATIPPTNTPRPTPTQEITPPPTMTPGPTLPPAEPDCRAYWPGSGLNVRSEPTITGAVIGSITGPTFVYVSEIRVNEPGRDEWGSIAIGARSGWIALWYNGVQYAQVDGSPECQSIRVGADEIVRSALGWHFVLTSVDQNDARESYAIWNSKGVEVAAKTVETWQPAAWALDAGGVGAARYKRGAMNGGDCANVNLPPGEAAQDQFNRHWWYAQIFTPPGAGYWIETDNECDELYFEVAGVEWLDAYLTREIELFSAQYGDRVVFGTMLAAGWNEDRVKVLRSTWDTALATGACLGLHQGTLPADLTEGRYYTVTEALALDWLWPYVWQHRDIRRWLMDMDPAYRAIPFCVTEWAVGGGWMAYDPGEFLAWARRVYAYDNVRMVTVYTAGVWNRPEYSVNGQMAETARRW